MKPAHNPFVFSQMLYYSLLSIACCLFLYRMLAFFEKVPQLNAYVVTSSSMSPTLPVNSLIITIQSSSIKVGDIITYLNYQKDITTHRVVTITSDNGTDFYTTKGDANRLKDDSPVMQDDIVGKTILSIPSIGKPIYSLQSTFTLAQK